jgi:hypothetical protein
MNGTEATELDGVIAEFAERLRALVHRATELQRSGVPTASMPDNEQISDQFWQLGLVGARMDDLMQSHVGLHAPVMATYEPDQHEGEDDHESPGVAGDEDGREVPQVLRLEFVLRSLADRSTFEVVEIADGAGQRLVDELTAHGCDISEWGSSIDDYEEPAEEDRSTL